MGKMQKWVTIGGGFIPEESHLELVKFEKLEYIAGRCELGGIHITINGEFYECIETTYHWEKNKFSMLNEPVLNYPHPFVEAT